MNPGGSIKDRAALSIVRGARVSGALKPGGTIVEGTAGNTGIGLALVGAALGHPVVIVMPRTQSEEKKSAVRTLGARLVEVDAAPFSSPNHFVHYSEAVARKLNATEPHGAFWANQFDNIANRDLNVGVATISGARVGNSSFTLEVDIRRQADQAAVARAEVTYVMVDARAFTKVAIPEAIRALLERGAAGVTVNQAG